MLWEVISLWYKKYKTLIPPDFLLAETLTKIAGDPEFNTEQVYTDTLATIAGINEADPVFLRQPDVMAYVTSELQKIIDESVVMPSVVDGDWDDVSAAVKVVTDTHKTSRITGRREVFAEDEVPVLNTTRITTNFEPLDIIMRGGWGDGAVLGIVGPSGGGKTSLAIQLAIDMAKIEKKHVLYLPYENKIRPEYWRRFVGCACGLRSDEMNLYNNMSDMPEETRAIVDKEWTQETKPYWHMIEMLEDKDGVEGVATILADFEEQGIHIELVVVDQYLQILKRNMQLTGTRETVREVSQGMAMEFMTLAGSADTSFILLHQKTAALGSANSSIQVKPGDAQEDKGFDNWLPFCIGLGNSDPNSRMWLNKTKSRHRSGPSDHVIRLDGDGYRLYDESKAYKGKHNGIEFTPAENRSDTNKGRKHKVSPAIEKQDEIKSPLVAGVEAVTL